MTKRRRGPSALRRAQARDPGRPKVRLLDDPDRFEIAAWLAFSVGPGLEDYPAARLVIFLAADAPITTESIDGVLLKSSTVHKTATVDGRTDRIVRKARESVVRANASERAWLDYSSGLIVAAIRSAAAANTAPVALIAFDLLRAGGWGDMLDRIGTRIEAPLGSNFPAADSELSRSAARLLRRLKD